PRTAHAQFCATRRPPSLLAGRPYALRARGPTPRLEVLLAQIRPPGNPVVVVPAFAHAGEVVLGNVDVHELDAPPTPFGVERKDQGRIMILTAPVRGAPRLDDEPLGHELENASGKLSSESAERRALLRRDSRPRTGDRTVGARVQVLAVERSRRC